MPADIEKIVLVDEQGNPIDTPSTPNGPALAIVDLELRKRLSEILDLLNTKGLKFTKE